MNRPPSTETATAISDDLNLINLFPAHIAFALGLLCSASAHAFITISLMLTFISVSYTHLTLPTNREV